MVVERSRSGMDAVLAACSMILGIFAVGTMAAIGYLDYTRIPWFDAWDYWIEYMAAPNPVTVLLDRMNEHRIVITRLLQLADLACCHADSRLLLWATYLIQFGSAAVLYRMGADAFRWGRSERVYAAGLILTFAFAAGQWINFTWLFLNGFLMIPFAVMAAFVLLKNSVEETESGRIASRARVLGSIGMALVATASLSNGVLVWPLLVAMAVMLRLPTRVAVVIGVVGGLVVLAYVSGDSRATNDHVGEGLRQPRTALAFALGTLGSAADEPLTALGRLLGRDWAAARLPVAILAGAIGLAATVYLAIAAARQRAALDRHRLPLLYTLAFFIVTSLLIGVGRARLPLVEALTARYVTFSLLFFACLLLIVTSEAAAAPPGRRFGIRFGALILALLVGGVPQLPKVAYAADTERFLAEGEYALINDVYAIEAWYRFFSAPGKMIPVVRYFREHRLSLFTRDWSAWVGQPVTSHFAVGDASSCAGFWDSARPAGGSYTPAVLAEGWALDRRFVKAPDLLVFADASGTIIGYATGTRRRLDVEAVWPQATNKRVGWVAFLPGDLAGDVSAFVRLGDERTLCPIARRHLPGAYLTAPAAKAGPVIPGVEVAAQGNWVKQPVRDSVVSEAWSSGTIVSAHGQLRIGPVPCGPGSTIGLPVTTSAAPSSIRVSIVERGTGKQLAAANPPPGLSAWDLWRLDVPAGAPAETCDYFIDDNDGNSASWIAAGLPRTIEP